MKIIYHFNQVRNKWYLSLLTSETPVKLLDKVYRFISFLYNKSIKHNFTSNPPKLEIVIYQTKTKDTTCSLTK